MSTDALTTVLAGLTSDELARATDKFPGFNSRHEGWAVLLEEVDELLTETETVNGLVHGMWGDVKADDAAGAARLASSIERVALRAAAEAVQVAAMARRYLVDCEESTSDEV